MLNLEFRFVITTKGCLMAGAQKTKKNILKNISVLRHQLKGKVLKTRLFRDKSMFSCSNFYMQLHDCRVIYYRNEIFLRMRIRYYFSIYVYINFGKVISL